MQSNHRTQFLFIHPTNPPSESPIEDDVTEKVDFIFSQLQETDYGYRGMHSTPFGKRSSSCDYMYDVLPIVSNSLAPYYIRHHRADISEKEIRWIHELYDIFKKPDYYNVEEKAVYYFKLYEKHGDGYGNAMTYVVKAIGNQGGIKGLLSNTFFRELTEQAFQEEIENYKFKHDHEIEGCSLIDVYDVLKEGTFKSYDR
jgi:hypothetical protein